MRYAILAALVCATGSSPSAVADELFRTTVFESGTEGYNTFRIPALIATTEGTLLAFCEGRKNDRRDHGDIDLVLKRSDDGGRTWGPLELVHEEGGNASVTIGNPCPVVDAAVGTIWLPFTRDNDRVFIMSSDDDGRTWSKPRDITTDVKEDDWNWYATGPGNGIQIKSGPHKGRLVIPCDHRVRGNDAWGHSGRSHVIYSDDHGRTWQLGAPTDRAMNECAVAELSDGRLMLNMRSYRGKACRAVAFSEDGGESWSPAVDDPELIEPVCQASLIRCDEGEAPCLLFSNPASEKTRHRLTVRLSRDDGETWPATRVLHAGPAAYSSLCMLPDGTAGILYEAGEKHAYEKIAFASFPLTWLQPDGPAE